MTNNIRFYYLAWFAVPFGYSLWYSLLSSLHQTSLIAFSFTFSLVSSACCVFIFCNVLKLWQIHTWRDGFQTNEPTGEGSTNYAKHTLPETAAPSETLPRPDRLSLIDFWGLFVLVFRFIFLIGLQHRFGSAIWFLKLSCSWAGRCVYSVALNLLRKKGSHPIIKFCLQTTALSPCPLWDTQRLPSALLRLRDKWQQQNHSNFSSSFSLPLLLDPARKSREWTQMSSSCSPLPSCEDWLRPLGENMLFPYFLAG